MYYGQGAGKLPTASAVVSDVVDCARHQGKTVMCFWDEDVVKPVAHASVIRRFFVRADKADLPEEEAKRIFGDIQIIQLQEMPEEYGFLTGPVSEKAFEEAINGMKGILGRIRLED